MRTTSLTSGPTRPRPPSPSTPGAPPRERAWERRRSGWTTRSWTASGRRAPRSSIDTDARAEASRDWWPLAMTWALDGDVGGPRGGRGPARRPRTRSPRSSPSADEAGVPVTAAAGRSGVCGGSVPVYGGVLLDLCELSGIREVDDTSLVVDVGAGTFGDHLEDQLRREHGVTLGHWPQSMALSTVGGWPAVPERRSALEPLRQDRGHGRRPRRRARRRVGPSAHRRTTRGRPWSRPRPALRRTRRAPSA
ncbi:MAG: FAD-dependent oxidoreductase [Acidimicrobiia bacterium]|nr:FAD-dependent oxidoreductase [Acidimicrobiia bacterium]